MVCIDCNIHGKRVHLLAQGTKDEYVFVTPKNQVFPDDCKLCDDHECPYNFNIRKLLKKPLLRKKIIDYVFDAGFDDMLLENGFTATRTAPVIYQLEDDQEIYSKPSYSKKNAQELLKLDKKMIQKRNDYFKMIDFYYASLKKMTPAPKRIIIKRKDRK